MLTNSKLPNYTVQLHKRVSVENNTTSLTREHWGGRAVNCFSYKGIRFNPNQGLPIFFSLSPVTQVIQRSILF